MYCEKDEFDWISQQLAELCMQGWMNDEYEPVQEEWEIWLAQKEAQKRKAERLEQHEVWADKLFDCAEGGAGMWHNISKPRPWRGGAQSVEDVFEGAQPLKRVEVTRTLAGGFTRANDERQAVGE